jgi:hypothetical protein
MSSFEFKVTITIEQFNVIIGTLTEEQREMYAEFLDAMRDKIQANERD